MYKNEHSSAVLAFRFLVNMLQYTLNTVAVIWVAALGKFDKPQIVFEIMF